MKALTRMFLVLLALLAVAGGCAQPAGPIFSVADRAIQWPEPPDSPRVRYVGQIATADDLKPPRSGWEVFRRTLAGRPRPVRLLNPMDVAHEAGVVYVADSGLAAVAVFNMRTRKTRLITRTAQASLVRPTHLALGPERLYVSDAGTGSVEVFDRQGAHLATWRSDQLTRPAGLSYCPADQRLYVADVAGHRIISFAPDGSPGAPVATGGTKPGQLNRPTWLRVDANGDLMVVDTMNFRLQRLDRQGQPLAQIGQKGDAAGDFALPKGLGIGTAGLIFVVDAQFENVQVFDPDGRLLLAIGQQGHTPGQFWLPSGIYVDAADRLWIADTHNRRIQVLDLIKEQAE